MKVIFLVLLMFSSALAGLKTPESAQFYRGKIYVSNIGRLPPDSKDGDGYISVLDLNGNLIKEKLCTGLNAPKGIAFAGGKLFVADIDRVVVFDPSTGRKLREIPIKGARFLNDTAYDGKRYVYVSDTQTNAIYRIDINSYEPSLFIRSGSFEGANGIAFDGKGNLIVASWGGGKLLLVSKKGVRVIAKGFSNLDGVCLFNGKVYFSDFTEGKIYILRGSRAELFRKGFKTPADIGCAQGFMFVPEFYGNGVKVLRIKR